MSRDCVCFYFYLGPRYIVISRPLHYEWVMTGERVAILLGSVWLISFCVALVPLKLPFHK
ncbi:hypothetical protein ElyMa_002435600, partial [Elysia marginata]